MSRKIWLPLFVAICCLLPLSESASTAIGGVLRSVHRERTISTAVGVRSVKADHSVVAADCGHRSHRHTRNVSRHSKDCAVKQPLQPYGQGATLGGNGVIDPVPAPQPPRE